MTFLVGAPIATEMSEEKKKSIYFDIAPAVCRSRYIL